MCGHVGAFGAINHKAKAMFNLLLHFDVPRGPHSTGIGIVYEDNNTRVFKEVGKPDAIYAAHQEDFSEYGVLKHDKVRCLIGHNRWKTQGAIDRDSAHPFEFGDVLGAHNGTVEWRYNTKLDNGDEKFQIDSQKIFNHLSRHENPQTIWDIFPDDKDAAMALVWWDKRSNALNIARNTQRPMFMVKQKNENIIYWASEKWMLELSADYTRVELEEIVQLKANIHAQFKMEAGKLDMTTNPLVPFVPPKVVYQTRGSTGYGYNWNDDYYDSRTKTPVKLTIRERIKSDPAYFVATKEAVNGVLPEVIINLSRHQATAEKEGEALMAFIDKHGPVIDIPGYSFYTVGAVEKLPFFSVENAYKNLKPVEKKVAAIVHQPMTMVSADGATLFKGKALRRAMRKAGNACACCGEKLFPNKGADGAVFISDVHMLCEDCNVPDVLDELLGKTTSLINYH